MEQYIAFDSHKHYTLAEREDVATGLVTQERIEHQRGAIQGYLAHAAAGTLVAVEALGSWYWIVEEIEAAGCLPRLVHPRKAKLMMGMINKTDKLDVHGLNRLQRNGTLPVVWIPPRELRELRELTRTRMVLSQQRTRLKNRITSNLAKYGLAVTASDAFGRGGRAERARLRPQLPEQTAWATEQLLTVLDCVQERITAHEERLAGLLQDTAALRLQQTLPGFGPILSAVVVLEAGDWGRFADAAHFASYAGTTPRVHSSGGKTRYGALRPDVNRYLKWAFVEAANVVSRQRGRQRGPRHVQQLYGRLRASKGHAKAVGAVARHLAEATYQVQMRRQSYRDPALQGSKAGLCATMP